MELGETKTTYSVMWRTPHLTCKTKHFCPLLFFSSAKKIKEKKMLECIKFGDCKVKTIQIGNEWFVSVRSIGHALGVNRDTLKGIVRNHLPKQYKYSRKEIGIDTSYDGSKLFTTIPGACRVILGSTHPDRHDVLDFLIDRHNFLQKEVWKSQKKAIPVLDDSIPVGNAKDYREHINFVFKLGQPVVLGREKVTYEYACLSRYRRNMKTAIQQFREKHPGSVVILKMANNPLYVWRKNRSILSFRNYFHINIGHDHILEVDKSSKDDN